MSPIVLGVDLGTTTITALAVDVTQGTIHARATRPNHAEITSAADRLRGRSEWDVHRIAEQACTCLRAVAEQLGDPQHLAGIGLTGQQHGVVLVDEARTPRTPLINWQDRRGDEALPGTATTYVRRAIERAGPDAPQRTGCRLASGYMGVTLFWMKETGVLPPATTACFLVDHFASLLTGQRPVTDPTSGASSGVLDIRRNDWDGPLLAALELPREIFPEVRRSGDLLGTLTPALAEQAGLPAGLPVFVGIGDNQASFLGSVAAPNDTVLVNVGTGGQVAVYTERFCYHPLLEVRPYPRGGYLLVSAGLSGGAAYAALERFYRAVAAELFEAASGSPVYEKMNDLAARVPRGADGLTCEPFFAGTRAQPELRASWSGVSVANFTPAHMTRALLEGMARTFERGHRAIAEAAPATRTRLVGAGNGLRENPVLARIVAEEFALPLRVPRHREEAAFGAALLAAVGCGAYPNLAGAGRLIQYAEG